MQKFYLFSLLTIQCDSFISNDNLVLFFGVSNTLSDKGDTDNIFFFIIDHNFHYITILHVFGETIFNDVSIECK